MTSTTSSLKLSGRQAQRLAHRAQVRVLGEVDLAVSGVHGGDQLQQALLERGRVGGERLVARHDRSPRVELVDVEGDVHRQRWAPPGSRAAGSSTASFSSPSSRLSA